MPRGTSILGLPWRSISCATTGFHNVRIFKSTPRHLLSKQGGTHRIWHFHLNSNHIYNLPFLCHSLASLSWAPTTLTQGQNAVNLIIASSFPFLGIIWPTKSASCVSHYVWGVSLRWLSQLMYVVLISKTHIILSSFIINDGWDLYCVILIYKSMLIYHTFQEN